MELPAANYLSLCVWKAQWTKSSSWADQGTACPPQIHTYHVRGKTENWPLVIVSRQLHLAPLWSQVTELLTFTMEIMTCSCARAQKVTTGAETPLATCDSFWRREFALSTLIAPETKVCVTRRKRLRPVCICMPVCVCVRQRHRQCWKEIGVRGRSNLKLSVLPVQTSQWKF